MIQLERHRHVARVTLNRPERRNALGTRMMQEFDRTLTMLAADETVRAIVLDGTPPCFCAGSDLKELAAMDLAGMSAHEAETAAITRRMAYISKPLIAAVEGVAIGGGFTLALACDLTVSAGDARWHLTEVALGWLPPWGLQTLLARVGPVVARRLTWGAEPCDGTEAHRIGLVDYVTEPGAATRRALELAEGLAGLPPGSTASTKRFFQRLIAGEAETLDAEANHVFVQDCRSEAARATFQRFGVRI